MAGLSNTPGYHQQAGAQVHPGYVRKDGAGSWRREGVRLRTIDRELKDKTRCHVHFDPEPVMLE